MNHVDKIVKDILKERKAQDEKWGQAIYRGIPLTVWDVVLTEEVGEVSEEIEEEYILTLLCLKMTRLKGQISKSILKQRRERLRTELVQVAAVAFAMIECLDTTHVVLPWGVNDSDAG
jgi:NTP pyrophosphatase (non-canonical NTP hydrolase)